MTGSSLVRLKRSTVLLGYCSLFIVVFCRRSGLGSGVGDRGDVQEKYEDDDEFRSQV